VTTALELRPGTGASVLDHVVDALSSRELLLVLDNCEHVLDSAAALVDAVRRSCPRVAVLATSRAPLEVTGEQVRVVPTLPAPPQATRDVAGVLDCASVRLFVDRAAAASRAFRLDDATAAHVAEICRRLDGLPLALELAAARMGAMTAADLAVRLSSRFSLLHAGRRTAADRHRTLRALVDWSYELLDEPSRRAFEVLSVFAGAFSLRDAERLLAAVDGSDTDGASLVLGLVDRSMVGATVEGDAATYALLDTLRAYGRERLAARGEQERVRRVHAELYTALAVDADRHLFGPGHVAAVERLTAALDELRAAWAWSLEHEPVLAVRLVGGMAVYVEQRMSAEVPGWAERTLRAVDDAVPELALVHGVAAAGARFAGDLRRARDHLERGLVLAAATGAPAPTPAYLRYLLSEVALFEGRLDEVDALAAAGAADETVPVTRMLELMPPLAAAYRGALGDAVRAAEAVHAAALRRGDETLLGWTTYVLGEVLIDADPARAATLFEQARHRALRHGDRYLAGVSLVAAAALHSRHGDPAAAVPLFRDVVQHWWDVGDWVHQWTTLRNVVDLLVRLRRDDEAAVLHAALTARADVAPLFGADAERMAAAARELAGRLGDEALAARAREGAALSDADVVALARAALTPDSGLTAG
jgi:predicted ATPase